LFAVVIDSNAVICG